jgi:hypothetical protein
MKFSTINKNLWHKSMLVGNIPSDYELISTAFGTGSSAVIDFTSIPSDYKHLQIRFTVKSAASGNTLTLTMNGITSSSYPTRHSINGNGTSFVASGSGVAAGVLLSQAVADNNSATAIASGGVIDILDYTSNSKNTTVRSFYGNVSAVTVVYLSQGYLNNAATIDRVTVSAGGNFTAISRVSLYGIRG